MWPECLNKWLYLSSCFTTADCKNNLHLEIIHAVKQCNTSIPININGITPKQQRTSFTCLKQEIQSTTEDLHAMYQQIHSQLDGPCQVSSPWWPERHSAGWRPPYICSDPWETKADRVRLKYRHRDGQNNRQAHMNTNKLCWQVQLMGHHLQWFPQPVHKSTDNKSPQTLIVLGN